MAAQPPPAVLYRYSPDRQAEHPKAHLAGFRGVLQADGCSGFDGIYDDGPVREAACWAHVRRHFFELHATSQAPLATEAVRRIGLLYAIEQDIRGQPPDERAKHRQARAGPILEGLRAWLDETLAGISGRAMFLNSCAWPLSGQRTVGPSRLRRRSGIPPRPCRAIGVHGRAPSAG